MQDLVLRLWPTLILAAVLGIALCASGRAARTSGLVHVLPVALGVLTIIVGAALAWFGYAPGLAGLWLDSALCHAVAYLCGCGLGCALRLVRRPKVAASGGA